MKAVVVVIAALVLAGCCCRPAPQRYRVVLSDGMTWWGPTPGVAAARARWYCYPMWRRSENIYLLGYLK